MKNLYFVLLFFSILQISQAQNGEHKSYYENGTIKEIVNYINGKKDGVWKSYYNNGNLKFEIIYANGKKNGIWKTYHYNGQIYEIGQYENGKKNGKWKKYYENGNLLAIGNYKNGLEHGKFIEYLENGDIQLSYTANEGKPIGDFVHYNDDGKLLKKGKYINGKETGRWIKNEYYYNGYLKEEFIFLNGKKDGVQKEYWKENGKLKNETKYNTGIPYESKSYYRDTGELSNWDVVLDTKTNSGTSKEYYENGKIQRLTTYKNEQKNGRYIKYESSGNIEEEGFYTNDKKSGYWKFYDNYGNIKDEGPYKSGKKNGIWKHYGTNIYSKKHKLYRKGPYVNGKKEGNWIIYNSFETQEEIYVYENGEKIKTIKDGITYLDDGKKYTGEKHYKNNQLIKTIKYIFKNNEIVDKETWVNGVLTKKLSDQYKKKETYYKIFFQNNCNEEIWVALRLIDKDGNWKTKAWYNIKSGKDGYLADTTNALIYYYVLSENYTWTGEIKKSINGKYYKFKKKIFLNKKYGDKYVYITCKK